jgi:hypothetical protein
MPFSFRRLPRFGVVGLVVIAAIFLALMYFAAITGRK